MSLADLIRKRPGGFATAIPAIPAIPAANEQGKAGTVARIATVAVANPRGAETDTLPDVLPAPLRPAPDHGADCMTCRHLTMRTEVHMGTRRIFWWRCERGHALLEGRNFGERTLLSPPACDAAGDFEQWQAGQQ